MVWDIPGMVQELSQAGRRLLCHGALIGGSSLQTHLESTTTLNTLETGNWDIVVLQEHYRAPENERLRHKFVAAATALYEKIVQIPAIPVLYASPNIEANGVEGFRALHALHLKLANQLNIALAGGGMACLRARQKIPGLDLHDKDRAHPNRQASYIGACVLYATLTQQSPVGLPNNCGKGMISADETLQFETAAWEEYQEIHATGLKTL